MLMTDAPGGYSFKVADSVAKVAHRSIRLVSNRRQA